MDSLNATDVQVGGFSVFGLLLAFSLIATFLFAVYWLWGCTCSEGVIESRGNNCSNRITPAVNQAVVPLYAFEIEPGTVVLQSGDGEIFRVLREYDSVGRTGSGSPPLCASLTTSPNANEFHYMPSYTRAHFQTRPSAPSYETNGFKREEIYTQHSPSGVSTDTAPLWTPMNIRSSE